MISIRARTTARAWATRRLLAVGLGLPACSSEGTTDPCPGEVLPAFTITVRAENGPLPADTKVRVAYGGGTEDYALGESSASASVMFCQTDGAGGGAGASALEGIDTLSCDLWVEGAATVWVNGGDYPEVSKELKGEANECGPQTVDEELVLGATDTTSGE